MSAWLGATWETVIWVVCGTVLMYLSALVAVRVAGRRTLTRLSAFDALVTIALGTLVGSTAVQRDPSYAQGIAAMLTLLVLQTGVAYLRQHSSAIRRLVDFRPVTLFRDGAYELRSAPWTAQVTKEELEAQLRQKGFDSMDDVDRVILEPSGSISVVRRQAPLAPGSGESKEH